MRLQFYKISIISITDSLGKVMLNKTHFYFAHTHTCMHNIAIHKKTQLWQVYKYSIIFKIVDLMKPCTHTNVKISPIQIFSLSHPPPTRSWYNLITWIAFFFKENSNHLKITVGTGTNTKIQQIKRFYC